jgi:hypothetical protein
MLLSTGLSLENSTGGNPCAGEEQGSYPQLLPGSQCRRGAETTARVRCFGGLLPEAPLSLCLPAADADEPHHVGMSDDRGLPERYGLPTQLT